MRQLRLLADGHEEAEQRAQQRLIVLPILKQTACVVNDEHRPRVARLLPLLGVRRQLQVGIHDRLQRRPRVCQQLGHEALNAHVSTTRRVPQLGRRREQGVQRMRVELPGLLHALQQLCSEHRSAYAICSRGP